MYRELCLISFLTTLTLAAGCSSEPPGDTDQTSRQPSAAGMAYIMSQAPGDAQDVIPMRKSVGDGQDVVVVGRIGGSENPWVDGLAAFSLVDRSWAACSDIPGDGCPTPWDYCCVTDKLPESTTLVKVVDAQDQVVSGDARELLGLTELQTVIVSGKANKDEAGNVTILAKKVYVDPANPGQIKRGGEGETPDHDHAHDHGHSHGDEHDHDHDKADDHGDDEKHEAGHDETQSEAKGKS